MLLCEWIVRMINAKTAVEYGVTAQWGSPDSLSDVDRVAVGAHKCHWSPKIQLQPSHCMKGYTYKHKQGMKEACLSSNRGAACSWAGYGSMEKRSVEDKGKAEHGEKGRKRNRICLCLRLQSMFLLWVALKEWAVELMQPNQAHVCAGTWCSGKCAWHPVSRAERRQTGPSIFQYKQISPAHLFFSHSHTPGVFRALLRPTCKGSFAITELYRTWR